MEQENEKQEGTGLGVFARLYWVCLAPAGWFAALLPMYRHREWFGAWEVCFFGVSATMILARYIEWKNGGALTLDGAPATAGHVRRYALGLVVVSAAAWGAMKYLASK